MSKKRCTKLNTDVLRKKDSNGDLISLWCRPTSKDSDAFCTLCCTTVHCGQHGTAAVYRHASSQKHIAQAKRNRNAEGVLTKSSKVQSTLDQHSATATSLQEKVTRAETLFALSVVANNIPYTYGDAATATYRHMFPDSETAKGFQCGRKKLSYIISDGLGPYFKAKVIQELDMPDTFYTIMIDEYPIPEAKVQQLDVLVRYYSTSTENVVVEHLQSFHLGHATADQLFSCIEDALSDVRKKNMVCFYSDGPNVMKSLKRRLKKEVSPDMVDIGECGLHKVHNAFAAGLDMFCAEVESPATDVHYYFKFATRHADMKELLSDLGLPQLEFLRHVNSRWLTLLPSVERILKSFDALKAFFSKSGQPRCSSMRHGRLSSAFCDKTLRAKLFFLQNAAQIFDRFQTLFQSKDPLLHVFYDEMLVLVKQVLGRFLRQESFAGATGSQLKELDVESSENWKAKPEIGLDMEQSMKLWNPTEKKAFYIKARAFYIACAKYLITRLPLNKLLFHLRFLNPDTKGNSFTSSLRYVANALPQVIPPCDVSSLTDEWNSLMCETSDWELSPNVVTHWSSVFALQTPAGQAKYPRITKLVKAALSLPHGNADCERGFSENKQALHHRSTLSITSISSLRQTKAFMKRYSGDATKVSLTRDILRNVEKSYKVYRERIEEEKTATSQKRKHEEEEPTEVCERKKLIDEKSSLQQRLSSLKALLASAQELISKGVADRDMDKVESGNILLCDVNSKLPSVIERIKTVDSALQSMKAN
ncbi:uncharacterized protein LOC144099438 [Amblyomma americanum]